MSQRPLRSIIRRVAQSIHAPAGTSPVGNYSGFGAFIRDAFEQGSPPHIQPAPPIWRFLVITPAMIEDRRERGMYEWSWHSSYVLPPEDEESSSDEEDGAEDGDDEEEEESDDQMPEEMRRCMSIMW